MDNEAKKNSVYAKKVKKNCDDFFFFTGDF